MIPIAIRDELIRSIEKLARELDTDAETLLNEWIERQIALAREQKIREESGRFRAQHNHLQSTYAGEYVAMLNGAVVDHGSNVNELYLRIRDRFGDEPVLIAPVTDSSTPTYQMRSPRVAGPA
ncbi:MAG: DUF5678 domain-containing protein [Anaerolineales bacterium]